MYLVTLANDNNSVKQHTHTHTERTKQKLHYNPIHTNTQIDATRCTLNEQRTVTEKFCVYRGDT